MLLALADKKGTVAANETAFPLTLGGALLAELLFLKKISVEPVKKKKMVKLENATSMGDPLLDECLAKLREAKRRGTLKSWVSRFTRIKRLRHRAAEQLCRRGILRADEGTVLLIFKRKIYPELDPGPEREVVERLRTAVFTETEDLDARTVILTSLAHRAGVLKNVFDKKELKARKDRLEKIGEGEITAEAVKEVVDEVTAAIAASVAASAAVSAAT